MILLLVLDVWLVRRSDRGPVLLETSQAEPGPGEDDGRGEGQVHDGRGAPGCDPGERHQEQDSRRPGGCGVPAASVARELRGQQPGGRDQGVETDTAGG